MENLLNRQLEFALHGSLSEYGLNPCEWSIDFSQLRISKNSQNEIGIENILVRSNTDSELSFLGLAKAKLFGPILKANWQSLSLSV